MEKSTMYNLEKWGYSYSIKYEIDFDYEADTTEIILEVFYAGKPIEVTDYMIEKIKGFVELHEAGEVYLDVDYVDYKISA